MVLVNQLMTPDSSHFWPIEDYVQDSNPPSYDKEFVRDWLEAVPATQKVAA